MIKPEIDGNIFLVSFSRGEEPTACVARGDDDRGMVRLTDLEDPDQVLLRAEEGDIARGRNDVCIFVPTSLKTLDFDRKVMELLNPLPLQERLDSDRIVEEHDGMFLIKRKHT